MYIKNIFIRDFRNLLNVQAEFNENYNIFYGKNAQGKTNILESIYYLLNAKSHRENSFINLINYDKNLSVIKGKVLKDNINSEIEIAIDRNGKKTIKINNNNSSNSELYEQNYAVMFSPDDLRLIKDGPEKRRKFLDTTLCKIDFNYKKVLSQYDKLLRHRNSILKNYSNYNNTIEVFDQQLYKCGAFIIKKRLKHLYEIEKIANKIHLTMSEEYENLKILYQSSIIDDLSQADDISEIYKLKLEKNFTEDIKKNFTSIGPHTDDINIFINNKYSKKFSSQGQQKTACIALKLSEIEIYKNYTDQYPVVLLDDVLSELDSIRQEKLLKLLNGMQVMLTDTNDNAKNYLDKQFYKLFEVEKGLIKTYIQ
ncbi:MAG: DNA replication/repair protein RecF [Eubacteriaceae bacterium]